jgi:KUP system potassium uptake protein
MLEDSAERRRLTALALGALGVVYGDIGTSPLYALRECFHGAHGIEVSRGNVLGVLSLVLWSLILLVSVKYLGLVVRADNKGEGGILALLTLAFPEQDPRGRKRLFRMLVLLGVFGTAMLYGDGMITPAISVLSAVEGLNVATAVFEPYIIPITVCILIALFSVQGFGTGKVGNIFGRITLAWFVALAGLGIKGVVSAPEVLAAINPVYGARFLIANGWKGFVVLGAVFLAVTGAEALYADLGHFGRQAIRRAWFWVVFPALVLNYFGQGALLLKNTAAAENPFYLLAPSWALYPHEQPRIDEERRVEVERPQQGFDRVVGHYGFTEEPDVPSLLEKCKAKGLELNPQQCSYFLSKETLIPTPERGMALWRGVVFMMMSRNATSAASFFKLPPNQVVELGMQIEI